MAYDVNCLSLPLLLHFTFSIISSLLFGIKFLDACYCLLTGYGQEILGSSRIFQDPVALEIWICLAVNVIETY